MNTRYTAKQLQKGLASFRKEGKSDSKPVEKRKKNNPENLNVCWHWNAGSEFGTAIFRTQFLCNLQEMGTMRWTGLKKEKYVWCSYIANGLYLREVLNSKEYSEKN